jgi:WD40 repeat protein
VTPDGTRVVSVSNDGTMKVWSLSTYALLKNF